MLCLLLDTFSFAKVGESTAKKLRFREQMRYFSQIIDKEKNEMY